MRTDGGGGGKVDGSHAAGLAFVPYDGYKAELHRGETILSADNTKSLVTEIKGAMAEVVNAMAAVGGNAINGAQQVAINIDGRTLGTILLPVIRNLSKADPEVIAEW